MSSPAEAPSPTPAALRQAFLAACRAELEALKPGNVHVHADGHGMTVQDFLLSAEAAAAPLTVRGSAVGARIRAAIEASWAAVPLNTNLGIVLLAAPLLAAAETGTGALRSRLARGMRSLTVADAVDAFAAIRRANPGGLGRAEAQDVGTDPTVTLLEAMRLAAGRDLIARQYATDYADVFDVGVVQIVAGRRAGIAPRWITSLVFLHFLAAFPDSHIARKFGAATAEDVRAQAERLLGALPAAERERTAVLLAFDRELKERGLNPGTSADLTVASLLASGLGDMLAHPAREIR
ncbi:MAG TPA: triphosphoribosyl-dephospho-CoA synthase [Stellaceae bacterium]|nr:triphosphoribosyl-dephospho-CoA synthase [Stellaceae bacterium]